MKKKILFVSVFAALIIIAISCNSGSNNAKNSSEMQKASTDVYYTCTMHPEVHSDKPGKCQKCGMELVKKEVDKSDSTQMLHNTDSLKQN